MSEHPALYALSPQQALLLRSRPGNPFRSQLVVEIPAGIGEQQLRAAFVEVVARHEALRTTFISPPGMTGDLQAVHDELPPRWRSTSAAAATIEALAPLLAAELEGAVDMTSSSPVSVVTVSLPDSRSWAVVTVWSACADPASIDILVNEVGVRCAGRSLGDPPLQYPDFAQYALDSVTDADAGTETAEHWRAASSTAPAWLPFIAVGPPGHDGAGTADDARASLTLGPELDAATLLAAWVVLTHRCSGLERVALPVVLDHRHSAELHGAIGAFATTAPVVVELDDDPSFATVVERVTRGLALAEDLLDAWPGMIDPVPMAFSVVGPPPAMTVVSRTDPLPIAGILLEHHRPTATITVRSPSSDLDTGAETARSTARRLGTLIAAAGADPAAAVSTLALVDDAELVRHLEFSPSGTAFPHGDLTISQRFELQVDRTPRRRAVAQGDDHLIYGELDRAANQLAHLLRARGVTAGSTVGLCVARGPQLIVALLAILKAGGAYVPLNREHPAKRVERQLEGSSARLVIADADALDLMGTIPVVCPDRDRELISGQPVERLTPTATSSDPVYVMYTSGSTGDPKGVVITHANLVNYCDAILERLPVASVDAEEGTRFASVTSITTDLGNTCVFPPLLSGGCAHLVDADTAIDPALFAEYARRWPIDVLKTTPSHLRALLSAGAGVLPRQVLVVGGEALSWDLVGEARALGCPRVLNHYGPTETTVGSLTFEPFAEADAGDADTVNPWGSATVPIGRPLANTTVTIVDRHGAPTPIGGAGELFIGGTGVAREYVDRDGETAERFTPDAFRPGGRTYRTGDLARFLPDGTVEFLGRLDDQVKIRGFRVEPKEIEHHLLQHPEVSDVAVVARDDQPGERRLVAYLVSSGYPTAESLRVLLASHVPEHMLPAAYVVLDRLPLTPSGKLDRQALPAPDLGAAMARAYVAPGSPIEETMARTWAEVLGVERVGVHDDFFELGGHSLVAAQIVARARAAFGVELPLHSLFTAPSVAELSALIVAMQGPPIDDDLQALLAEMESLTATELEALTDDQPERPM